MLKYFSANSMVMRSTRDLHSTDLRSECHKIFYGLKRFQINVLRRSGKSPSFGLKLIDGVVRELFKAEGQSLLW
jgi:hypothetical protein